MNNRSGKYLYKPEMKKTCCPAYTIRLDCTRFSLSKGQKKSRRKVEKYLEGTLSAKEMMEVDDEEGGQSEGAGGKSQQKQEQQPAQPAPPQAEKEIPQGTDKAKTKEKAKAKEDHSKAEKSGAPPVAKKTLEVRDGCLFFGEGITLTRSLPWFLR